MLKHMRSRFILAAVAAFGIVLCILACGINIVNYTVTAGRQDEMLEGILDYEQMKTEQGGGDVPMISDMPWANGPEADYTTRFFVASCDENGDVTDISQDHISSVDEDAAAGYADKALAGSRKSGYVEQYRYRVEEDGDGDGYVIGFLDVSQDQKFVRSLLIVTAALFVVSMAIVFVLVLIFSKKAVRPYVEASERQKKFITNAGHELKTPIASIATSADVLAVDAGANEWVRNIQKQSGKLSTLVKNLVELARLDEEIPFPEKSEFSLSDAAWEISEPFAAMAGAMGKLYSQNIEDGVMMTGDRDSVRQLISILLDNAIRYSDAAGNIKLSVRRIRSRRYIEVYNTCVLPDIDSLDRLFDRFYRPDESRSSDTGGTGIGLAMAQSIAEAHGGRMTVRSTDGKSITFTAIL